MANLTIEQGFQLALQHHQAGRLAEAEHLYRQILAVQPDEPDVLHHLGIIAFQAGRVDAAAEMISRSLQVRPGVAAVLGTYGAALRLLGRLDEAVAVLMEASAQEPASWHFNNLGNALKDQGRPEDATAAYARAIELQPDYADAHYHLGLAQLDLGNSSAAVAALRRAIALQPDVLSSAIAGLLALGDPADAAALLMELLDQYPDRAAIHYHLGLVRRSEGCIEEALACFEAALMLRMDYAEAQNERGIALSQMKRHAEALATMHRLCQSAPGNVNYWYNYGTAAIVADEIDQSLLACSKAFELDRLAPNVLNNLGSALKEAGRLDEAIDLYKEAAYATHSLMAGSNWVYMLHFHPGYDAAAIDRAAREWDAMFAAPLRQEIAPCLNNRDPQRRLRIGYVSPDFRGQAEAFFVLPLLESHDHERFEIHCYSSVRQPDPVTERHRAAADVWHEVAALSDAELAERVRADEIDILVDLTMQMGYNRLPVFARKPAPVQVAWLAYPGTTGLATMDYRITDGFMDPEGADESCYSEKSIRLPDSWCCYDPLGELPDPGPPPAISARFLTFGSLNAFYKLNQKVVELWAQVMHVVAGSRLLLLAPPGAHRERLCQQFGECGIAAERIEFVGRQSRRAYLEAYQRIDIAMDPFPYNGITSTCDALWMGVPVVSRIGTRAAARAGLSLLSAAGRPEWVAQSDAEFVAIAAGLAADLDELASLRCGLRESVANSPLADGRRFAKNLETAYRDMWATWCGGRAKPLAPPSAP